MYYYLVFFTFINCNNNIYNVWLKTFPTPGKKQFEFERKYKYNNIVELEKFLRLTSSFLNLPQQYFPIVTTFMLHYWQRSQSSFVLVSFSIYINSSILERPLCLFSELVIGVRPGAGSTCYRWRLRVLRRACTEPWPTPGFCWRSWSWSELSRSSRASAWGEVGEGEEGAGRRRRRLNYLGLQTLRLVTENSWSSQDRTGG